MLITRDRSHIFKEGTQSKIRARADGRDSDMIEHKDGFKSRTHLVSPHHQRKLRTMSKKWRIVLLVVLIIAIIPLVLLITDLGFKVSFLWTINGYRNCEMVSSNGKWVACDATDDSITIISTKFPFRKVSINLPELDAEKDGYYFRNSWYDKWSPQGSNLYLQISPAEHASPIGFCILNISDDGNYKTNCIKNEDGSSGSFKWATSGEKGFTYVPIDNATYAISLYNKDGSLLNHFIISRTDSLLEGEEIDRTFFIWDGADTIYQWVGYQKKTVKGEVLPSIHRIEIHRISIKNPTTTELIFSDEGNYVFIKVDPTGHKFLFFDKKDMYNRSLLVFDIETRKFVDTISIDIKGAGQLNLMGSSCLESCSKTAIDINTERLGNRVLVWSWSNASYQVYPSTLIAGKLDYLDGFLCVYEKTRAKKIKWVFLCR